MSQTRQIDVKESSKVQSGHKANRIEIHHKTVKSSLETRASATFPVFCRKFVYDSKNKKRGAISYFDIEFLKTN